MKAVMVGSSPAAACVVVRTPTDEHSVPQRPLTAKYYVVVNDSENGAAFFYLATCACFERAEAAVTAPLLLHPG